jgi:hypothetical protein
MRRATYLVLAAMLVLTAPAWAQYSDPLLGPHVMPRTTAR